MNRTIPSLLSILALSALAHGVAAAAAVKGAPAKPGTIDFSNCPRPTYPIEAQRRTQEGTVTLAMLPGADGTVLDSKVAVSSLYPRLDQAALEALSRCKIAPMRENGKPVKAWVQVQYVWTLDSPPGWAPPPGPLTKAPERLRDYLAKARLADAIADPLQRCLAFPDHPDSKAAPEVVKAYCHYKFEPSISLATVQEHLDTGTLDKLEQLFRRNLERHFSSKDFSEVIHRDLGAFDGGAQAGRIAAQWLARAPDSAFALAASGIHTVQRASDARGFDTIDNTKAENYRQMVELVGQSYVLLRRALELEPRMMPAHAAMLLGARMSSDAWVEKEIILSAQLADAGCFDVAGQVSVGLKPRWSGSHDAMREHASQLQLLSGARPLLISMKARAAEDKIDYPNSDKQYADTIALLKPYALEFPSTRVLAPLTNAMVYLPADRWETLATSLTLSRFEPVSEHATRERARILLNIGEAVWAARMLENAAKAYPGDVHLPILLGRALYETQELEQAMPFFEKALAAGQHAQFAQHRLMMISIRTKAPQAEAQTLAYVTKYPDDAYAWLDRGQLLDWLGKRAEADASFLKFRELAEKKVDLAPMKAALDKYLQGPRAADPTR
ncbi:TonB family protein [Massilia sp. PAMC28688]|uniref:energy transducer TonB n=1 Tax=Massilia sp. PAMC28688 TaxID=2861283 RepID=UPI001C62D0AD|nr:energy transducer TonB [Massilia sp. PAMC28688]QYF94319.1 TonB family protein [Massilia sp. PAMC28688]